MSTTNLPRRLGGLALTTALALAVPGVAWAESDTTTSDRPVTDSSEYDARRTDREEERSDRLEAAKDRVLDGIAHRLEQLDRLAGQVRGADHLSEAHEDALAREIDAARVGIAGLRDDVEAAETAEDLHAVVEDIKGYGVFVLLTPKVHLVVGADAGAAAVVRLSEVEAKIQGAVDRAAAEGHDVSTAQAHLDAMAALTAEADALLDGLADRVVGLTTDDEFRTALHDARSQLSSAKAALRDAGVEGHQAVAALRDAV